jgi:hypothetical protein
MAGSAGVALATGLSGGWLVAGTIAVNAAIGAGVGALGAAVTGQDVGRGALIGAIAGGASAGLGMAASPAGVNSGGFFTGAAAAEGGATLAGTGEFLAAGTELTASQLTAAGGGAGGVFGTGFGPNISAGQAFIGAGGAMAAQGQVGTAQAQAAEAEFRAADKVAVASFNTMAVARDVREFRRSGSALAGARRAVSAASGIRGSTGQALSVTTELEREVAYQAAILEESGSLETGALLKEAEFLTAKRASLLTAGSTRGTSTLLSTAGRIFA